jgi:hypothetical protein
MNQGFDDRTIPEGLRGNSCRPSGTRYCFPFLPGTSVPGFHMPPLSGLGCGDSVPPLRSRFSSYAFVLRGDSK